MYKDIDVFLIAILVICNKGLSSKSVIHHMWHSQRTQFIKHFNEWENFGFFAHGNWLLTRVGNTWRFDCMNLPPPDLPVV